MCTDGVQLDPRLQRTACGQMTGLNSCCYGLESLAEGFRGEGPTLVADCSRFLRCTYVHVRTWQYDSTSAGMERRMRLT